MKICGLIGGMSWESSLEYYKIINEEVNKRLGALHSGKIILYSVDFEEIAKQQKNGDWEASAEILSTAAKSLEKAGSDFVMITTNTMHKVADSVQKNINIPLVDIREALCEEIKKQNIKNILLLGTRFTMEDAFYISYLKNRNINVTVPDKKERDLIHSVIFNELCLGITKEESKNSFLEIINNHKCEGVILGCTEIGMLISQDDTSAKVLDTTHIHALKAVELMLDPS